MSIVCGTTAGAADSKICHFRMESSDSNIEALQVPSCYVNYVCASVAVEVLRLELVVWHVVLYCNYYVVVA